MQAVPFRVIALIFSGSDSTHDHNNNSDFIIGIALIRPLFVAFLVQLLDTSLPRVCTIVHFMAVVQTPRVQKEYSYVV